MMMETAASERKIELLKVQNQKKPEQVISVVRDPHTEGFHTEGLKRLFGLKEIWIDTRNISESVLEYAQVLSFIMETISEAQDLNLPYGYQDTFTFRGLTYALKDAGNYRVLRRIPEFGQAAYDE
ncbi:MAG: hypothetical protein ACUVWY_00475 [Desulfosoma sp.]|uniref:hypothetical protein n=2 Tax=Desulfosoma sp. TaxID=2603217 RepID=UPI00404947E1